MKPLQILEYNWLGFLKNGWSDNGEVASFRAPGSDEFTVEVCSYCKRVIHVFTHKGGSRCKACPTCLKPMEVYLENIKL